MENTTLNESAVEVVAHIRANGFVETRTRELEVGDAESVPWHIVVGVGFAQEAILETLESLDAEGLVTRFETAHPHDTTEFVTEWRLAPSRERNHGDGVTKR